MIGLISTISVYKVILLALAGIPQGGHNILMIVPLGAGKAMLAKRLPTIYI